LGVTADIVLVNVHRAPDHLPSKSPTFYVPHTTPPSTNQYPPRILVPSCELMAEVSWGHWCQLRVRLRTRRPPAVLGWFASGRSHRVRLCRAATGSSLVEGICICPTSDRGRLDVCCGLALSTVNRQKLTTGRATGLSPIDHVSLRAPGQTLAGTWLTIWRRCPGIPGFDHYRTGG